MFDIIVVGGGPIGSEVAFLAASAGRSVAVIEKRPDYRSRVCCTGIISLECIDSFAIDPSLVKRRFSSARVFSPSGNVLHFERPEPLAGVIERADLDSFMAKRAQKEGANYIFNATALSMEFATDNVTINIKEGSNPSNIIGKAVVIATGAVSSLLTNLPDYSPSDIVVGAQVEVDAPEINEIEIFCGKDVAPGFFAWLVPVSDGRALVGLLSRQKAKSYIEKFLEKLKYECKIGSSQVDINYRAIALKQPENTFGERLMIVGGAAGQVKPTTGGGIYFGLLSAQIVASTLEEAFKTNDFSARSLSLYATGWKKILEPELSLGRRARSIYERMDDAEINALFNLAKSIGVERYLLTMKELSFDWHGRVIAKSSMLFDYLMH